MSKGKGFPTKEGGKEVAPKVVETGGACNGGGSAELAKAAKSINVGNRKGGLPGL